VALAQLGRLAEIRRHSKGRHERSGTAGRRLATDASGIIGRSVQAGVSPRKERNEYLRLVVSTARHKLQRATPDNCNAPPAGLCGTFRASSNQIIGDQVSMEAFATRLSRSLGRTVIDKTKLDGIYNLLLQWTPDAQLSLQSDAPPHDGAGPSIFTAMQQHLGLRLQSARGQVEVLVIDHVQRPSEN
jgi:uncharacterized protein (TIGR03435 family)